MGVTTLKFKPAVFGASVETQVEITVHDPDVLERVTGPGGDEWRSHFYPLNDNADVIEHLAYNYVVNGVDDIRRLDGWADVAEDAVTFKRLSTDENSWSYQ